MEESDRLGWCDSGGERRIELRFTLHASKDLFGHQSGFATDLLAIQEKLL